MIDITRELAVEKVKVALKAIADFSDSANIEEFDFSQFHDFHKQVFTTALKNEILDIKGSTYYFDVALNQSYLDNWANVGECIDYLVDKTTRFPSETGRLQL